MAKNKQIDRKESVLKALMKNSRLSYRQIAKKTGISIATVMHKAKELEKEGIIKNYTAHIDYDKMGYDVQVMVHVRVSKGQLSEVEQKIAKHSNVFAVYDITGDFDVAIIAKFKNRRTLDGFLKKIQKYDFVERVQTILILNVIKEENLEI